MTLNYSTLEAMRQNHPAWKLLRSDHASLVASFLYRVFIAPNVRFMSQADLAEALEDELFAMRERTGGEIFPRPALEYLNDWAAPERGWLRKFYRQESDEPYFDLTASAEKAIVWLTTLTERSFVGTESRLLTLFELLKKMVEGSERDPQARIAELERRRNEIDREMARVLEGDIVLLDDTALKDRFQQFVQLARDLLFDFREVEANFRKLDRRVRERIALWEGSKGALLAEIMGERDAIADSDEGRSFRAFWDLLMSSRRQEELTSLLDRVFELPAVSELNPDPRIHRVHYDWLDAGEQTQRTVADLSKQLRRFLDDQAWVESRRIMNLLRSIEARALALRKNPPASDIMTLSEMAAQIELPMERRLATPGGKPRISSLELESDHSEVDATALFSQVVIDKAVLAGNIRQALQTRSQITLAELCEIHPLEHGLAELISYLELSNDAFESAIDESRGDMIVWQSTGSDGESCWRRARVPRVIFVR
ncbi:MAG: DUF3375 domain-containing protein [Acidobacteria bacterium]|nr:DUF3375 domain-containing protein [Acidobacteriota bacterium]